MTQKKVETRYALGERHAIVGTFLAVGPDAPTLCEGWASQDLAAHLVVREGQLLAALGNAVAPLAGYTDRVQRALARRTMATGGYEGLIAQVGRPQGFARIPRLDEALNLAELFVHHEDLLRAQPDWRVRTLPREYSDQLWRRVGTFARMRLARTAATLTLRAPGFEEVVTGRGGRAATVEGEPSEVLLYVFGRTSVARVTVDDPSGVLG